MEKAATPESTQRKGRSTCLGNRCILWSEKLERRSRSARRRSKDKLVPCLTKLPTLMNRAKSQKNKKLGDNNLTERQNQNSLHQEFDASRQYAGVAKQEDRGEKIDCCGSKSAREPSHSTIWLTSTRSEQATDRVSAGERQQPRSTQ